MRLFLAGDVMTGRGIDQILPSPADPALTEAYMRSARDYVALAERVSGPIPRGVPTEYPWGEALAVIRRRRPALRVANLETALTADGRPERKAVTYRMHPANVGSLTAAGLDCCVLANNHVLDWGRSGLEHTLAALSGAGIATAGAGMDAAAAARPAVIGTGDGPRLVVLAYACPSSGTPRSWEAGENLPGVALLPDLGEASVGRVAADARRWVRAGDAVMVSIHWGANWVETVPEAQSRFARALVETAGVHLVHGHSAHHPLGIETISGRPVLHGCGDFLNDYEGIGGREDFRPDIVLAWFVDLEGPAHALARLEMVPFRLRRFRLERAGPAEMDWIAGRMDRACRAFGNRVERTGDGDALRLAG